MVPEMKLPPVSIFFSAEVFFDVNDPNKKFDRIKGWVQVVR